MTSPTFQSSTAASNVPRCSGASGWPAPDTKSHQPILRSPSAAETYSRSLPYRLQRVTVTPDTTSLMVRLSASRILRMSFSTKIGGSTTAPSGRLRDLVPVAPPRTPDDPRCLINQRGSSISAPGRASAWSTSTWTTRTVRCGSPSGPAHGAVGQVACPFPAVSVANPGDLLSSGPGCSPAAPGPGSSRSPAKQAADEVLLGTRRRLRHPTAALLDALVRCRLQRRRRATPRSESPMVEPQWLSTSRAPA